MFHGTYFCPEIWNFKQTFKWFDMFVLRRKISLDYFPRKIEQILHVFSAGLIFDVDMIHVKTLIELEYYF